MCFVVFSHCCSVLLTTYVWYLKSASHIVHDKHQKRVSHHVTDLKQATSLKKRFIKWDSVSETVLTVMMRLCGSCSEFSVNSYAIEKSLILRLSSEHTTAHRHTHRAALHSLTPTLTTHNSHSRTHARLSHPLSHGVIARKEVDTQSHLIIRQPLSKSCLLLPDYSSLACFLVCESWKWYLLRFLPYAGE